MPQLPFCDIIYSFIMTIARLFTRGLPDLHLGDVNQALAHLS